MLNPLELLGLTPPIRIKGVGVKVIEGEARKRKPRKKPPVLDMQKRREYLRQWVANNRERVRASQRAGSKRYYWKDVEKSRAYHRERQAIARAKAKS